MLLLTNVMVSSLHGSDLHGSCSVSTVLSAHQQQQQAGLCSAAVSFLFLIYFLRFLSDNNNNNNDRLTAFDPGQPG